MKKFINKINNIKKIMNLFNKLLLEINLLFGNKNNNISINLIYSLFLFIFMFIILGFFDFIKYIIKLSIVLYFNFNNLELFLLFLTLFFIIYYIFYYKNKKVIIKLEKNKMKLIKNYFED